jgi:DNA polymerase III delta prime subunit
MHGNIDNLRNNAQSFASTSALDLKRKYIIWDESERITQQAQDAIRGFIEMYADNCGHIFTCNKINMMSDAIKSRCSLVDFSIRNDEKPNLMKQYYKVVASILKNENIEFDKESVADYIVSKKSNLDFRNILMELQHMSKLGKIDKDVISNRIGNEFSRLLIFLKGQDFNNMRKWVSDNSSILDTEIFDKFYNEASDIVEESSLAYLVILLAKYQFQASHSINKEINLAAFLTEVMVDVKFK